MCTKECPKMQNSKQDIRGYPHKNVHTNTHTHTHTDTRFSRDIRVYLRFCPFLLSRLTICVISFHIFQYSRTLHFGGGSGKELGRDIRSPSKLHNYCFQERKCDWTENRTQPQKEL